MERLRDNVKAIFNAIFLQLPAQVVQIDAKPLIR